MMREATWRHNRLGSVVGHCLTILPFALLPTLGALIAHAPVSPPYPQILFRAVFLTAAAAIGVCLLLIRLGWPPPVSAAALAVAAGLSGLFPTMRRLLFGGAGSEWAQVFALCYLIACVVVMCIVLRSRPAATSPLYPIIKIMAAVLTIGMVLQVWQAYATLGGPDDDGLVEQDELAAITLTDPIADRPDVYHIILDGFGRPDVLRDLYGLDVSHLVEALKERGFHVAEHSGSANYAQTVLSVASMLNVRYLEAVASWETSSRAPLYSLIQRSSVITAFKRLGYEVNFFGSIYSATQSHRLADRCECGQPLIGEFESTIIRTTLWGDLGLAGLDYVGYRNKTRRVFAGLAALGPSTRPRLLFAHLLVPHPPFVFDAEGRDTMPPRTLSFEDGSWYPGPQSEYEQGYREQVRYVASKVVQIVDRIEEISRQMGRDPVIIVHGDHGPRFRFDADEAANTNASESLPIFLAIRWSGPARASDVSVTSLVNVYREFFRRYFDANLQLLPNRGFVSSFRAPYKLIEVDHSLVDKSDGHRGASQK